MRPCSGRQDERDDPRMNANDVIRMGRSRRRAAARAASLRTSLFIFHLRELHDEDRILGRETDQHNQADLGKDVVFMA